MFGPSELDSKNNPKTAQEISAWEIVAKHFNDPTFSNLWSHRLPLLHEDFKDSLDLSHEHDVAKFGDVPAIKVKQRISELRCKLNILKVNHGARSGMGDGAQQT